ncbi:MAG TPA: response regulator [Caulobacteraceae bacterium]|jgi:signal transduction histidine kinase/ActR/RegA family two-component response regulator
MFRHLRTKLTVLYAGLFAATLALIALVALEEVSQNARQVVSDDLTASGAVFERVWAQRMAQFETDGRLLSRDFGFRTAVASRDIPTIRSALQNLKVRLGIDTAALITPDGAVISADDLTPQLDAASRQALQGDDTVSGVLSLGGAPYEAVAIPMGDGTQAGWLVFADKLDAPAMQSLESMAAIPLTASVAYKDASGAWRQNRPDSGLSAQPDPRLVGRFAEAGTAAPLAIDTQNGAQLAVARPLKALTPGQSIWLIVEYPLAKAMGPYRLLLILLLVTGAAGLGVLIAGTWVLARTVTRPISQLEDAARRLQRGEAALVEAQTQDEIGRLAETFNAMSAEIHQREHELASALEAAEAASRAKSSFLTNMSHEVRTPLNGVIGIAGVLAGTPLEAAQKDMVGIIQASAAALQHVLDDVLELARAEAGKTEITCAPFDLAAVVRRIADGARADCLAKGLAFELVADPSAMAQVEGDEAHLRQILSALLGNAVKFTEQGGVTLSVSRVGRTVRFEVSDTGVGFDPAIAAQLFKPFQQADGSLTRRFGGSGLGLCLARDLARAMGGDITASGLPGRGATFVVEAPLRALVHEAEARPEATSAAASADASNPDVLRILVADDHPTNRQVAKLILDSVGVDVVCAEDGQQAVAEFERGGLHLILMDMQMPVMDGLTAIRTIRRLEQTRGGPRLPILMLSANAMPEHVAASLAAGADGHVAKPVTPPQLIGAVEAALGGEADDSVAAVA